MADAHRYLRFLGHRSLELGSGVRHGESVYHGKIKFDLVHRWVLITDGTREMETIFGTFCFLDREWIVPIHMEVNSIRSSGVDVSRTSSLVYRSQVDSIPIHHAEG